MSIHLWKSAIAPDLVIENFLSFRKHKEEKWNRNFKLYEENGVKEYWIVYHQYKQIVVFALSNELVYDKTLLY